VRANPATFLTPAAVDNLFDLDRDGRVNANDLLIVRDYATLLGGGLPMITPQDGVGLRKSSPEEDSNNLLEKWQVETGRVTTTHQKMGQDTFTLISESELALSFDEDAARVAALTLLLEESNSLPVENARLIDPADEIAIDLLDTIGTGFGE
jgi:hypothetical protein